MSLSLVRSRALIGLQAAAVTVEVHLANGLPSFTLVGLADVEVKEARERVRSALQNSGLEFPHNKRITVNLAPADLPKDSGRFDLPIALGILAASGQVDAAKLAGWEFAGELSLSGELRPARGALAMSLALHAAADSARLVLPAGSAEEAALVPNAQVYRADHLLDVVRQFLPDREALSGDTQGVSAVDPAAHRIGSDAFGQQRETEGQGGLRAAHPQLVLHRLQHQREGVEQAAPGDQLRQRKPAHQPAVVRRRSGMRRAHPAIVAASLAGGRRIREAAARLRLASGSPAPPDPSAGTTKPGASWWNGVRSETVTCAPSRLASANMQPRRSAPRVRKGLVEPIAKAGPRRR
jgi:hypothetical protein